MVHLYQQAFAFSGINLKKAKEAEDRAGLQPFITAANLMTQCLNDGQSLGFKDIGEIAQSVFETFGSASQKFKGTFKEPKAFEDLIQSQIATATSLWETRKGGYVEPCKNLIQSLTALNNQVPEIQIDKLDSHVTAMKKIEKDFLTSCDGAMELSSAINADADAFALKVEDVCAHIHDTWFNMAFDVHPHLSLLLFCFDSSPCEELKAAHHQAMSVLAEFSLCVLLKTEAAKKWLAAGAQGAL